MVIFAQGEVVSGEARKFFRQEEVFKFSLEEWQAMIDRLRGKSIPGTGNTIKGSRGENCKVCLNWKKKYKSSIIGE